MANQTLIAILKSIRPMQWLKNLVMFAPLIFSGLLFSIEPDGIPYFVTVVYSFIIFCILASSIYLINDIIDYQADRLHPFKKKRPIAAGELKIPMAFFLSVIGIVLAFFLSFPLNTSFRVLLFIYLLLQILYSTKFKNLPILDIISIAASFVLRVYAGATVGGIHLNSWFLLTLISASLFLAVGKRQGERTLMVNSGNLGQTRGTLRRYGQRLLDQYTSMFATASWVTYALFTFQYQFISPDQNLSILYPTLPKVLRPEKLLMFTIPLAILGIMRYLELIYENNQGEAPEKVLTHDTPLLITLLTLLIMIIAIIYGPPALNAYVAD